MFLILWFLMVVAFGAAQRASGTPKSVYRMEGGDGEADLDRVGWYRENSGGRTHRVGEKSANPWGLYDVHGNVREWCLDGFQTPVDFMNVAARDPIGPGGMYHPARGGSCRIQRGSRDFRRRDCATTDRPWQYDDGRGGDGRGPADREFGLRSGPAGQYGGYRRRASRGKPEWYIRGQSRSKSADESRY